jgi:very-short-patch-repair endonuclease
MPVSELRPLLRESISALKGYGTHEDLPEICKQLGMPPPPGEGTKRERLKTSFDAVPDAGLPDVAERFLLKFPPSASVRNEIQELLWANSTVPEISKKCRHELARSLQPENLYRDARHFMDLIERLWVIDDPFDMIFGEGSTQSLRAQLERHVINNHDWDGDVLFEQIGAFTCTNHRFKLFLEGLASADVRRDEAEQHVFVRLVNVSLGSCRIEVRETANEGGYPVFRVVATGTGTAGRPKNLIFASPVKPDLRFRDAVNNDIEIISNADRVLVYERPIPSQGLRWCDLQDWWAEHEHYSDQGLAKKSLYRRLLESLPESPPQKLLFATYFRIFRNAIPVLPVLLPEVWLHWDPKTVKERGPDALLRSRMDFLMLLPNGVRVVIEVDGAQHYTADDGNPSPRRYADMMSGDRDLRLRGYDLYRFGAADLLEEEEKGHRIVQDFFERLFGLHNVNVPR